MEKCTTSPARALLSSSSKLGWACAVAPLSKKMSVVKKTAARAREMAGPSVVVPHYQTSHRPANVSSKDASPDGYHDDGIAAAVATATQV